MRGPVIGAVLASCIALLPAAGLAQVGVATGGATSGSSAPTPSSSGSAAPASDDDECAGRTAEQHAEYARERLAQVPAPLEVPASPQVPVPPACKSEPGVLAPEVFDNQFAALDAAEMHARCARNSATKEMRFEAYQLLQDAAQRRDSTRIRRFRYLATVAADEGEIAERETVGAKSLDVAKTSAVRARAAADKARENRASARGDTCLATIIARADENARLAEKDVSDRERATDSICGLAEDGHQLEFCGTYGLFAAALSYVYASLGNHSGTSYAHLTSVAVPSLALRYNPKSVGWLAAEFGGYSAFLTKSLSSTAPDTTKAPCARDGGEYERRLPCEANTVIYPYLALYLGVTAGRSGVGYITIAPITAGVGQVGSRAGLKPFIGYTVGVLQLNGRF